MATNARFIVAEISKNWATAARPMELIRQQFEELIAFNLDRGYVLHSFSFSQVSTGHGSFNETIVAVFELAPPTSTTEPEPKGRAKK